MLLKIVEMPLGARRSRQNCLTRITNDIRASPGELPWIFWKPKAASTESVKKFELWSSRLAQSDRTQVVYLFYHSCLEGCKKGVLEVHAQRDHNDNMACNGLQRRERP